MSHRTLVVLVVAAILAACSGSRPSTESSPSPEPSALSPVARAPESVSALPNVPAATGPLDLRLVYPRLGAVRPSADSTFLFGSTGTGRATLTINGTRIPLAPNGAFLAYLPVTDTYRMVASDGERRLERVFRYGQRVTPADAEPMRPQTATVIAGRDTLAAGSEIVAGRTTRRAPRGKK